MTAAEGKHMADELKLILLPELVSIATVDNVPAAFCLAVPDLNEMIRDLKGGLLPFGWAKFAWRWLTRRSYVSGTRVLYMGVRPEYKNKPMGSVLALLTVGAVRDATGNYDLALTLSSAGLLAACMMFLLLPRYPDAVAPARLVASSTSA